jgi:hypothetical protein
MKDMTKAEEKAIVGALEEAVKLANEGNEPNEALFKVAQEKKLAAEVVRRMVEAFNVSKTLSHLDKTAGDARAHTFPIASAENILQRMFPAEPETPKSKAAELLSDELGRPLPDMMKAAGCALPPMTDKTAEPYARDPEALAKQALDERQKLTLLLKQAEDAYRHVFFKLWEQIDKAAAYWRQSGPKEAFELVEKRAYATYGPPARTLMDIIHNAGNLGAGKLNIKRAEEMPDQQMHFDSNAEPYHYVADALLLTKEVNRLAKEAATIQQAVDDHAVSNMDRLPQQHVFEAISRHIDKQARDMPGFTEQDRPEKVKDIYRALKREHPRMPAEMKARIAARQGKPGKQKQGPPYKGPLARPKKSALDDLFVKE